VYDAGARRDIDALLGAIAPEIEIYQTDLVPWGGSYHGHEEAQTFFARLIEHVDSELELGEFVEADDHVVHLGRSRGRVRRAAGAPFDVREVHVWTLRDGTVARFEAYLDTPPCSTHSPVGTALACVSTAA
jgi:ketosteroid isomerase-like protein